MNMRCPEVAIVHDARHLTREFQDNRLGRAGGREQPEPSCGVILSAADFRQSGDSWEQRGARFPRYHEAGNVTALQLRDHVGQRENRDGSRSRQDRIDHLAAAPERHPHDIRAGLGLELFHEIRKRERKRAVAQRAGPGFGERNEIGYRLHFE
jgi:hypothetical protein